MKWIKSLAVLFAGVLSALYLLNVGVGIMELLPDNIPLAGNIDEVIATIILTNVLAYFGIDLGRLLGRRRQRSQESRPAIPQSSRVEDELRGGAPAAGNQRQPER